jgi:hypothetical protein
MSTTTESDSTTAEPKHEITTTAQVERTYLVQGATPEQAHDRLRAHLKDAAALREGLVVELRDKQIDATPQRVKASAVRPRRPAPATV